MYSIKHVHYVMSKTCMFGMCILLCIYSTSIQNIVFECIFGMHVQNEHSLASCHLQNMYTISCPNNACSKFVFNFAFTKLMSRTLFCNVYSNFMYTMHVIKHHVISKTCTLCHVQSMHAQNASSTFE